MGGSDLAIRKTRDGSCLKNCGKSRKSCQDRWCSRRESNGAPPDCKSVALLLGLTCSVQPTIGSFVLNCHLRTVRKMRHSAEKQHHLFHNQAIVRFLRSVMSLEPPISQQAEPLYITQNSAYRSEHMTLLHNTTDRFTQLC
jgi:hypothetical protein